MARGPNGMRIVEDEEGVRPTGIGTGQVRGFSTDLPSVSMAAGIQAGRQLQDVAADLTSRISQKNAIEAAKTVELGVDENGQYVRPEAPWGYGLDGMAVYEKVTEQRLLEQVYRDWEETADQIHSQHFREPEIARTKLDALSGAFLKRVDPMMASTLQPLFQREGSERMRGILNRRAADDYRENIEHLNGVAKLNLDKAYAFELAGDNDRADENYALARGAIERQVAVGAEHPGELEIFDSQVAMRKAGGAVVRRFEEALQNGTLSNDHFRRIEAMLLGGGNPDDEVLGLTKKELSEFIPSAKMQQELGMRLNQIQQRYVQGQAARDLQEAPAKFLEHYTKFPRSGQGGMDDKAFARGAEAWLKTVDPNLNILDPRAVNALWDLTGTVPAESYKSAFKGVEGRGPNELRALRETWNALKGLTSSDGREIGAEVLSPKDEAFMVMFDRAMLGATGATDEEKAREAAKTASAGIKLGMDSAKEAGDPLKFVASRATENAGRSISQQDIRTKLDGLVPGLDAEQVALVATMAVPLLAANMDPDEALKRAGDGFKANYRQSDLVLHRGKAGAWVHKDFAIPAVTSVAGGRQDTEWVGPIIGGLFKMNADKTFDTKDVKTEVADETMASPDLIFPAVGGTRTVTRQEPKDPLIPPNQFGRFKIENPELKKNVFLVPSNRSTGNPLFELVYKPSSDAVPMPLRTKDGLPVRIRLGEEAKLQEAAATKLLTDPDWRGKVNDRILELGVPELGGYDASARIKTPGDIDPARILAVDDLPPEGGNPARFVKPNRAEAAAARREVSMPARRDGMSSPFQNMVRPSNIVPGEVAIGEDPIGERLDRRSSLDFDQLFAFRRDERTRLEGMHPRMAVGLTHMISAMPPEVKRGFRIGSAVRTNEEQQSIFRSAVLKYGDEDSARKWAARPGHSRHEHGVAADLQMNAYARKWVHQNAERFGLHFPMEHEPWHIEPIGSRRKKEPEA